MVVDVDEGCRRSLREEWGDSSDLYLYDPPSEATSGEGLTVPGKNGTSHVSFCYDEEAELSDLTIQKTGAGTYDLQHSWSIDKQVKRAG